LPKSVQSKAKEKLHQIWMADSEEEAGRALAPYLHHQPDRIDICHGSAENGKGLELLLCFDGIVYGLSAP